MDVGVTTTLSPNLRESLLTELKNEFNQSTEGGPVIFEIQIGTECFDVLVVWEKWNKVVRSEDRTRLILDAYDDKQKEIAQALGVTYEEAIQQQLLPYTIVSNIEKTGQSTNIYPAKDELWLERNNIKRQNGGITLPNGNVELRFPTRAMLDNILAKLRAEDVENRFGWCVIIEL
jgi:hypothetical protein